jgi:hypothetical protein
MSLAKGGVCIPPILVMPDKHYITKNPVCKDGDISEKSWVGILIFLRSVGRGMFSAD